MKSILSIGLLLAITLPLLAATPYVPTDAERARWTMLDMNSWKGALAGYAKDHGTYPEATTLEEARKAIEGMYIVHAPMHDAWGNPFRYERTATGYRLVSAGADGAFQSDAWTTGGKQPSFSDDAVVTNEGRWLFRFWDMK